MAELSKDLDFITRELFSAHETGQMVDILPSNRTGFYFDAAYAVEAKVKQLREAAGKYK